MAVPGRPLDDQTRARVRRDADQRGVKPTARMYGISPTTVRKILRMGIAK